MLVPRLAALLFAGVPFLGPPLGNPPLGGPAFAWPPPAGALPLGADVPPAGGTSRIAVWTDRDGPYRRGEAARVYLRVDAPSWVAVFRVDTDGRIRALFPRDPWSNPRLHSQRELELTGGRDADVFRVDDDPGVGYLFAIAADRPLDFRPITRGNAWDYRLIGGRVQGDPYVALTDLAARLSPAGAYDYDIAPYYVGRHYDYPRFVCYDCHASAAYDEWNPYALSCSRYRVVIRDDPSYYPYRYGGRNVVPGRPVHPGPRYVFQETSPAAERGSERTAERASGRAEPWRRRAETDRRGEAASPPAAAPPGRRDEPSPRQAAKPDEAASPAAPDRRRAGAAEPRSTGEPELRRRRP
jgi:hypothetical protein